MCHPPPSSLKLNLGRPPSPRIVVQDEDGNNDYLEVELEEDPLESNPKLEIDLYPESDYDSVPPYSSLSSSSSSLPSHKPRRRWLSTSRPYPSFGCRRFHRGMPVPTLRPLCHLVGVIIFIIALP